MAAGAAVASHQYVRVCLYLWFQIQAMSTYIFFYQVSNTAHNTYLTSDIVLLFHDNCLIKVLSDSVGSNYHHSVSDKIQRVYEGDTTTLTTATCWILSDTL